MKRTLLSALPWTLFIIAFTAFLLWFNLTLTYPLPADAQLGNRYERAVVVGIQSDTLAPDPAFPELAIGTQTVEVEVLTGESAGTRTLLNNFITRTDNKPLAVGTEIVVSSYDGFLTGMVVNYSREKASLILILLFLVVVLLVGRLKGLKAIFALAFTLICVIFLFIPLLLRGVNPIVASLLVVALSCGVTLLALNGFSAKTVIAGVACILCTLAAGAIAFVFGWATHLSTYTTPEAEHLIFIAQNTSLQLHDIMFAAIIIAASGALMDMTMSITSALFELKELNPGLPAQQVTRSGMNIGRDVMGTMTNTLILAFTGSSINTLLVIFMYNLSFVQVVNMDELVVELVQGLAGAIAIVLSVPITAVLAA
ncbi:MAG: YibE/F family protein, partial [Coriobacteriales bacterium]|nr:YibE/F family protein [Coriobacteriales bacterium]